MRNTVKTKENNQKRCYTYVKSREHTTAVVNMGKKVDIVGIENKTVTVPTAKNMDTSLKTVTERRSTGKNACTVTVKVAKKRSSGRNKNMKKKDKEKIIMSLKIYITTSSFLAMKHFRGKIKNQQGN